MVEQLVSKTGVRAGTVGSNPTPSATSRILPFVFMDLLKKPENTKPRFQVFCSVCVPLNFSIACSANRFRPAAFVYRFTSFNVVWPS